MTSIADTVASYVPWLVARQQLAEEGAEVGSRRFKGAVLLADVSGFTALTERLAEAGPGGAETMTNNLNAFFSPVIDLVTAHGGDIVKFAGDAILAVWHGWALAEQLPILTRRAVQCGLALQSVAAASRDELPFPLSLKVCIGAGDLALASLGGERNRREAVVLGEPISSIGTAARQVRAGQVALTPAAWDLVSKHFKADLAGEGVRIATDSAWLPVRPRVLPRRAIAPEATDVLVSFLPGAIRARVSAGQGGWLAEIRQIAALFVNLPDLGWDSEPARSQELVRALQRAIYRFEGSVNKLSVDEKGVSLLAAMGLPPLAHRDDAVRAVRAALEIREALDALGCRGAIGVASGPAFCGEVGNATRREYTIMGDAVNLAARLMQATPDGEITCDEATYRQAQGSVAFRDLPRQAFKGKTGLLGVYRPAGLQHARPAKRAAPMVGRSSERLALERRLHRLRDERAGGVIVIEGEAGIGKSRLVADFQERTGAARVRHLSGQGDPIEQAAPFHAWRSVFGALFGLARAGSGDRKEVAALRERVLVRLGDDQHALARAPLLNAVLPLDLPETDLTRDLEDRVRAQNTLDLLVGLLGAEASARPLVVVVEDAQWLDSASRSLVGACARQLPRLLLLVSSRPVGDGQLPAYGDLAGHDDALRIRLDEMPAEEALELVCHKLGVTAVPEAVSDLLASRAAGHPFFTEELALALRDAGVLEILPDRTCRLAAGGTSLENFDLPTTVQGTIVSRVDRLGPQPQLVLKVASVIGRRFGAADLAAVYPIHADLADLASHLDSLVGALFPFGWGRARTAGTRFRSSGSSRALTCTYGREMIIRTNRRRRDGPQETDVERRYGGHRESPDL